MITAIRRFCGRNKWYCLIIAALVIFFFSLCSIKAASDPFLYTKDEALHFDYAYQVSKLQLPVFFDGSVIHPEKEIMLRYGEMPDVQWTYQHPPLYYALLAPVVGPALDSGHIRWAIFGGRMLTVLIGCLFVLASAWLGYVVANRNRLILSVLVACFSTSSLYVVLTSAAIYNDILFLALSTATAALAIKIYKESKLDRKHVLLLALVCSLGMLSRLAFAFTLVFALLLLLLTIIKRAPSHKSKNRSLFISAASLLAVGGIPFVASFWFYVRNYMISGSFSGAQPEWAAENLGRPVYGLFGAIADGRFWSSLGDLYTSFVSFIPMLLLVVGVGILLIAFRNVLKRKPTKGDTVTIVLGGYVIGILIMFCGYVSIGGAANVRYLLSLVPIVSLIPALLVARFFSPMLTVSVVSLSLFMVALDTLLHQPRSSIGDLLSQGPIDFISGSFQINHIPTKLFFLLMVSLVISYCVLLISMYKLKKKAQL